MTDTTKDPRPQSPSNGSSHSPSKPIWQRPLDDPSPFDKLRTVRLDEKQEGYPRLAEFIASDPNFAMFRNPSRLRNRLLLWRQIRITKLEDRLDTLDNADAKEDPYILQSQSYDNTRDETQHLRDELLQEMEIELKAYDELLLRERTFRSLERPAHRNYRSLLRYLDVERPLAPDEEAPFLNPREIVSIAARQENTWLEGQIEDLLLIFPLGWVQKLFTDPEMRARGPEEIPVYFSKDRLAVASKAVTIILSLSIAMIPTSLLFSLRSSHAVKILIMLVAIIMFSGALAACTRSRHQDIFMATAAFCAVLVAFLSQGNSISASTESRSEFT